MEHEKHEIEKWVVYLSTSFFIISFVVLWIVFVYTQKELSNNTTYFWLMTLFFGIVIINRSVTHYIRTYNLGVKKIFNIIIIINYFIYILLNGLILFTTLYYKPYSINTLIIGYLMLCIGFVFIEPYQRYNNIVDGPAYLFIIMGWFLVALAISTQKNR